MRRCQVFNIFAGVSVPSFAIKPGMSFYAGLRERGEHILEYVFWGVFRSLLWHVPFTVNPPLFLRPLRVNGMAGVSLAPMPPGIALKTAAARYAPLRLHLAASSRCAPAFSPVFLRRLNSRAVLPWPSRCDILAEGFSAAEWSAWNNRTCRRGPFTCSAGKSSVRNLT